MRMTLVVVQLALLGSIAAFPAAAQERQRVPRWPPEVRAGKSVWLIVDQGGGVEIRGEVVEVSTAGLRLRQDGELREIALKDVRRIDVRDSLRNGTLIGAAIGAAAVGITYGVLAATICPGCGEAGSEALNSLEWATLGAGIGAITGLSLDAMRKGRRTIYLAPVVSRSRSHPTRRFGATVTVSW